MEARIDAPWAWLATPPAHHRAHAAAGVWRRRTLAALALELTAADPAAAAFIDAGRTWTRAEVVADAEALAIALHDLGLRPGDVISFQVPNWAEAAVINLAAAWSGLVINPIVPIYRDAEVGMMLADCRARVFFVAANFRGYDFGAMAARLRTQLPALQQVVSVRGTAPGATAYEALLAAGRGRRFDAPVVDPGGVKMLLYTSGTTGRPKGVLHSHDTLARALTAAVDHWGLRAGDRVIMPSPVTHVSGYANGLELPFIAGTCTVLMETWNAEAALQLILEHDVVGTVAATPFLMELAAAARRAGTRLPSLRYFACGGAAVSPDLVREANAAFANGQAFRMFGASEVPNVTLGFPASQDADLAAATDGQVIDYEVRIEDAEGRALPDGVEGEILARGPAMFLGYADQQQTAEAITADGYFRTGDLGHRTPEGALVITGRKKDLIIRGGENISAREIEDVLQGHPAVREAAVVAMPHERLGEGVCAYVIAREGQAVDAKALVDCVLASGLAKQKIPERFEFVPDFPRTASGKVRKDQLRAAIREKLAAEGGAA